MRAGSLGAERGYLDGGRLPGPQDQGLRLPEETELGRNRLERLLFKKKEPNFNADDL